MGILTFSYHWQMWEIFSDMYHPPKQCPPCQWTCMEHDKEPKALPWAPNSPTDKPPHNSSPQCGRNCRTAWEVHNRSGLFWGNQVMFKRCIFLWSWINIIRPIFNLSNMYLSFQTVSKTPDTVSCSWSFYTQSISSRSHCAPHRCALSHWVIQVQVSSNDVQLDSQ